MKQSAFELFAYGLLYLTVLSLWFPKKLAIPLWPYLLIAALFFGFLSQQIAPVAFVPIILLPLAIIYQIKKEINIIIKIFLFIMIVILCVGLAAHLFPGFNSLIVSQQIYFNKDALPFTLALHFDKPLIGIFILGISHQLITHKREWISLFKQMRVFMLATIFIVIILAFLLHFVRFAPKLPKELPLWIITNLLFTTTAEEAFFRGFIQKELTMVMRKSIYGNYFALFFASILFGLAHYPGGGKYVLLATIAGLCYGFIYQRTARIEASIITHFALNLTHILFFTYPALPP